MLEFRTMELRKVYNLNSGKIKLACATSVTSAQALSEVLSTLERACAVSRSLYEELSASPDCLELIEDMSELDSAWANLREMVEAAAIKRSNMVA